MTTIYDPGRLKEPINKLELLKKVIGEFQKVPYYTKPLETLIGVTKGLKVYKKRYEFLRHLS